MIELGSAKPGKEFMHKSKGLCQFIALDPHDGACYIMEELDREDGEIGHYFSCERHDLFEVKY